MKPEYTRHPLVYFVNLSDSDVDTLAACLDVAENAETRRVNHRAADLKFRSGENPSMVVSAVDPDDAESVKALEKIQRRLVGTPVIGVVDPDHCRTQPDWKITAILPRPRLFPSFA